MSGEFDAAGGLATAGLVAASIEGSESRQAGEGECLNCGAQLSGGRFCSNCGQPAHANRSLWMLLEELLWNVFNLDTKAWRTLPRLMFRPGSLTREYIEGKRARYLTPLATFLLCYFFMFLAFSTFQAPGAINLSDGASAEHVSDARENLNDAKEGLAEAQKDLQEARTEAGAHPNPGAVAGIAAAEHAMQVAQEHVRRREAALLRAQQRQNAAATAPVQVHVNDDDAAAVRRASRSGSTPAPATPPAAANGATNAAPGAVPAAPPTPNTELNDDGPITLDDVLKKIAHDNITVDGKKWLTPQMQANLSNPPLFYSHLQEAASRWGFLLVPLSLPFIAFLFLFKKNVTLFDHCVFALNSLSFASLIFSFAMATAHVPWVSGWAPALAVFAGLPVHTFFHVGGAYKLKWWSAFWRTWFLLWFATFVLCFFFVAVLFIGLAG
ncbi:MAG: DUF3667 domain-containing protein [Terricaulis sp.]